jgi:hypothetical protein
VRRSTAPGDWKVRAEWKNGLYTLDFDLAVWQHLDAHRQLALVIWRGAASDRGGLKSVSPGWIELEP